MHRLLVMNIDGTVLQPNGKIHKSVKEAIDYVQSRGVKVSLVTSHHFMYAKKIAKALKLNSMVIAHNGAFIASSIDQAIFVKRIEEDILIELIQFLESLSCGIRLVHEKFTVSNIKTDQKSTGLISRSIVTTQSTVYRYQYEENLTAYANNEAVHPTHIEVTTENEQEAQDIRDALTAMYDEVDVYQNNESLKILPKGVSKMNGLLYAAEYWNINLNEIVAIGSSLEELEMVQSVGLGVAMGNAPQQLKDVAKWVTRSNIEQGVYYMVYEHFRKQQPFQFLEKLNGMKNEQYEKLTNNR